MPKSEDHPSFASSDDLRARWADIPPALTDSQIEVVLDDVSDFLTDLYPSAVKRVSDRTLRRITCAVARRSLEVANDLVGLESTTETAGQVSLHMKPANPHGDYYLTAMERRALQGPQTRAWNVDLLGG